MGSLGSVMAVVAVWGSILGSPGLSGNLHGTDLVLESDDGSLRCTGHLVRIVGELGRGSLHCSDGRTGDFHWKLDASGHGEAYGRVGAHGLELHFEPS